MIGISEEPVSTTALRRPDRATSSGAVNSAGNVARTKKMLLRALETQTARAGFSFVEILTMCPTGWFIETQESPDYLAQNLASVHATGILKDTNSATTP